MKLIKRFKCASISLAILLGAAIVGWLSNATSIVACQQQVGSWLWNQPVAGRFFYLLDPSEDGVVRETFTSLGAEYTPLASHSNDPKTWPRLSMKTRWLIPFLISVDYFWEREAEIGGGGTKWFICLFGRVVPLEATNEYAT